MDFGPKVSIEEGIGDTIEWYRSSTDELEGPFNVFVEGIDSE